MSEVPQDVPALQSQSPTLPVKTQLVVGAIILSVVSASLAFFHSRGLINLYGDAMAHLEGARRIIDSLTPGYTEIGTVWLPLPHLLMALPAQNDFLWRTGLAGGIVSALAFALAAFAVFRLSHEMNGNWAAAAVALAGFLLCPNMLYLASTPLTEPLAILCVVLLVYALFRFRENGSYASLVGGALAGFAGTLTRYECWSLLPFAILFILLARNQPWRIRIRHALVFSFIAGLGPVLWFLHNAYRYGNPLEFYNGPFSAKAIYEHQLATTAFRFPTDGSLLISARYYLEDLQLVIGVWPLVLALLGLIAWAVDRTQRARRSAALLFLLPLPFQIQSMAHAAIPLYVPTLFPHTYWNLRLGIEMLPAVAIFPSFLLASGIPKKLRLGLMAILLAIIIGQHAMTASRGAGELAVAKEGVLNTPCHSRLQQRLAQILQGVYDGERILITTGRWPCVFPALGIPFRKTLGDANREFWAAMRVAPERKVKWIVRGEDEPVDWLIRAHPQAFRGFEVVLREDVPGEGSLTLYRRKGG